MTCSPAPPVIDPAEFSFETWRGRRGAYASHHRGEDDPEVRLAQSAMSWHRITSVLDAEAGKLLPEHLVAVVETLRRRAGLPAIELPNEEG